MFVTDEELDILHVSIHNEFNFLKFVIHINEESFSACCTFRTYRLSEHHTLHIAVAAALLRAQEVQ